MRKSLTRVNYVCVCVSVRAPLVVCACACDCVFIACALWTLVRMNNTQWSGQTQQTHVVYNLSPTYLWKWREKPAFEISLPLWWQYGIHPEVRGFTSAHNGIPPITRSFLFDGCWKSGAREIHLPLSHSEKPPSWFLKNGCIVALY